MTKLAVCVIVERDGAVLAVQRRDSPLWGLPGGKADTGELLEQAATRELAEETGLVVDAAALVPVLDAVETGTGCRVVTFWAPDPGGQPAPRPGEAQAVWAGWCTVTAADMSAFPEYNVRARAAYVDLVPAGWISTYGSGSLRRAREEGLRWHDMYLCERAAFEIGYGFEPLAKSRLVTGDALAEGDSPATTETCWWARALRYRSARAGRADEFRVVHARYSADGEDTEGVAVLCMPKPRPAWLPASKVLVAFTTDRTGRTVNPC